jgi:hypothetical protein
MKDGSPVSAANAGQLPLSNAEIKNPAAVSQGVVDPDANPYYGQSKAINEQITGKGTGGTGTDANQGGAPAQILSQGLANQMGVPVGTVVPSGTLITPSTTPNSGGKTVIVTPSSGQTPAITTTVTRSPDNTITKVVSTGQTITTTPTGQTTVVTNIAVPTVTPVTSGSYYNFTNQTNQQNVQVGVSQYNSWTPAQQFVFQQSLGTVPKDAIIQINPDGTWGYIRTNNPTATLVGDDKSVLGRFITTASDGTKTVDIVKALASGVTVDYILSHTTASINDIKQIQSTTSQMPSYNYDTWAASLPQEQQNFYNTNGKGIDGYNAVVQSQLDSMNKYQQDIYSNAYNASLKTTPNDTVVASQVGLQAVGDAYRIASQQLSQIIQPYTGAVPLGATEINGVPISGGEYIIQPYTGAVPSGTTEINGIPISGGGFNKSMLNSIDETVFLAAGYTPAQVAQIYGQKLTTLQSALIPAPVIIPIVPFTDINGMVITKEVKQITKVPTGMDIALSTPESTAISQSWVATSQFKNNPTDVAIKNLQNMNISQNVIDYAQTISGLKGSDKALYTAIINEGVNVPAGSTGKQLNQIIEGLPENQREDIRVNFTKMVEWTPQKMLQSLSYSGTAPINVGTAGIIPFVNTIANWSQTNTLGKVIGIGSDVVQLVSDGLMVYSVGAGAIKLVGSIKDGSLVDTLGNKIGTINNNIINTTSEMEGGIPDNQETLQSKIDIARQQQISNEIGVGAGKMGQITFDDPNTEAYWKANLATATDKPYVYYTPKALESEEVTGIESTGEPLQGGSTPDSSSNYNSRTNVLTQTQQEVLKPIWSTIENPTPSSIAQSVEQFNSRLLVAPNPIMGNIGVIGSLILSGGNVYQVADKNTLKLITNPTDLSMPMPNKSAPLPRLQPAIGQPLVITSPIVINSPTPQEWTSVTQQITQQMQQVQQTQQSLQEQVTQQKQTAKSVQDNPSPTTVTQTNPVVQGQTDTQTQLKNLQQQIEQTQVEWQTITELQQKGQTQLATQLQQDLLQQLAQQISLQEELEQQLELQQELQTQTPIQVQTQVTMDTLASNPPPDSTKVSPPIVYSSLPSEALDEKGKIKKGTITWRQGSPNGFPQGLWKLVPPPYNVTYTMNSAPKGVYKYATGKGSAYKTLQVLGGNPDQDVDVPLGWANIHISATNGQLDIDYTPNEKANVGTRENTIGMGEGQIPYAGVEEDLEKAKLTYEQREELAANPELTVDDFYKKNDGEISEIPQETPPIEAYYRRKQVSNQMDYDREAIGERPEEIPEHVRQRMPRQQVPDNYIPRELQKVELPQYRYGRIKVYLVNGDYIRTRYADESIGDRDGVDFCLGGHHFVYWKLIPNKNEIWIERNLLPSDRKAVILHEMTERRKMESGMEYSEAHNDYANPPEIVARTNPHLIDKMIKDEMAYYETPQPKIRRRYTEKLSRPLTVAEIEKKYEKYSVPISIADEDNNEIANKYYLGRRIEPKVEANAI